VLHPDQWGSHFLPVGDPRDGGKGQDQWRTEQQQIRKVGEDIDYSHTPSHTQSIASYTLIIPTNIIILSKIIVAQFQHHAVPFERDTSQSMREVGAVQSSKR